MEEENNDVEGGAQNNFENLMSGMQGILDNQRQETETEVVNETNNETNNENNTEEVEAPAFDIGAVNTALGTKYKDINDFKTSSTEREVKYKEMEETRNRTIDDYEKQSKFMNETFGDKEKVRQFMIQKKFEGQVSPEVAARTLSADIGNMTPLEAIVMAERLKNPNLRGGDEGVRKLIMADAGIESADMSKLTDAEYNKLERSAFNARKELVDFQNTNVDAGEMTSLDKVIAGRETNETNRKTGIENTYTQLSKEVSEKVESLKIEFEGGEFSYAMNKDDKNRLNELMKGEFANYIHTGTQLSKETVAASYKRAVNTFKGENMSRILNHVSKDAETAMAQKKDDEFYNPRKGNQSRENPKGNKGSDAEEISRLQKIYNKPFVSSDPNSPMGY